MLYIVVALGGFVVLSFPESKQENPFFSLVLQLNRSAAATVAAGGRFSLCWFTRERSFQFSNENLHNSTHSLLLDGFSFLLAHSANLINHMHIEFSSVFAFIEFDSQKRCSFGSGNGFSFAWQN